jgi:hypothetical protein
VAGVPEEDGQVGDEERAGEALQVEGGGPSAWTVTSSAQTCEPPVPLRTAQKAETPMSRFVSRSSGSEIKTIAREG